MNKREQLLDVREVRQLASPLAMRDATDPGHIVLEGYASTFEPYDVYGGAQAGGWVEQLDRRAFDKTLDAKPDVHLLINHEGMPLARTKSGTLELSVDHHGLKVRARLDRSDPDVQRLLPKMARGDMDEMSFAFRVLEQDWDKTYTHRTIHEVNLQKGDVSVVNWGMNPTTSAAVAETVDALAALPKQELAEVRRRLGLPAEPTRVGTALKDHREQSAEPTDVAAALRRHGLSVPKPAQRSSTTATSLALRDIPAVDLPTRVPIDSHSDKHLVYRRGSALHPYGDEKRSSWIADLLKTKCGMDSNGECRARLAKHAQQVRTDPAFAEWRDISTVDGDAGFAVPPKYLIDDYVLVARPGRAFADCCTNETLPAGTDSVNLPAATQGTAAAIQTADNTEIVDVDITDTLISAPVRTIAGQIGASIELIEQAPVDLSAIIFRDLIAAHATQLDLQVIAGTGENGQVQGIDNTPGVQSIEAASSDIPGFFNALAQALYLINSNRYEPPEVIVMSPIRYAWICSLLDSEHRPLLLPYASGATNMAGVLQKVAAERIVGQIMGLPIVLDASVTMVDGSDTVYIGRTSDLVLWESPFKLLVRPQVKAPNLTVVLQAWNYSAFACRYPSSVVRITGLAAVEF
ncbi:HK97 family phage prohead protease [Mycobacterium sp. M23085]|uniref:HK97 family phage prohead protease n=1 Tax=Mycobacterium sp. M23085 TaxID=3378087 RepID=UPI003877A9BF